MLNDENATTSSLFLSTRHERWRNRVRSCRSSSCVFLILSAMIALGAVRAQTSADSITITFRTHESASTTMFVPGEFNGWGPNSDGLIAPGAVSQMTYDPTLGAWIKTYTFRIHDAADSRRTLGDSVFQYKFNRGGLRTGWFSDPLNPEQNRNEYNNSVLRMTKFFWFQYYPHVVNQQIVRITVGLIHSNSDSIVAVKLTTGATPSAPLTTTDVTTNFEHSKRILDFLLAAPIGLLSYVRLVAYNSRGDSVALIKGGYDVMQMPMPSGTRHGVNLPGTVSTDSTTFRLRLKGRSYILLRIAPLGQTPADAPPLLMRKSTNSDDWWLNLKLPDGTYEYVYELENGQQINDPWGRRNGDKGTRFTIGAEGLTADDYVWQSISYRRPPLNKLIIYELHVGEFAGGFYGKAPGQGTFRDLITLLPYLDSLGVNAIELMPINDYGFVGRSGHSWGYDVNSYFALEPAYGEPRDFKALVDAAHARGIAVIVDVVFNHLNDTSPLWQMEPDESKNAYFKPTSFLRPNEDPLFFFKDLDHWSYATQELVFEALKMWIEEYRVDGFRYDFTQGIGWDKEDTTVGILGWANKVRDRYKGAIYQIAEHLPESPALLFFTGLTGGWHDSFHDEIFNEARFRNVSLSNFERLVIDLMAYPGNDSPAYPNQYSNRTQPVNCTVNHDEQSLIYEMTTFQNVGIDEAVRRDKLYGTFMFTSLGIPMLWQGVEFSAPRGWRDGGERLSYRALEWNWFPTARGKLHYDYYRALVRQRRYNPALFSGELIKLRRYEAEKVLVWGFKDSATDSRVVIVANLSGTDQTLLSVPWLGGGTWYNVFDQSTLTVSDDSVRSMTVPGYTAVVFSNRSNESLGIPVTVEAGNAPVPSEFKLYQNYPNPFNSTTTISYEIATADRVSLKIYDILGREVSTLVNKWQEAGFYTVRWNGLGLDGWSAHSGVYFARLVAGSFSDVKRLILIR